ncbi:GspH/FimT family pseudopilin [Pseudoxanthomonas sp. CAU 1598]|uniref:Type II secretion system protein H n=2 Tax=Pseudomarimonas arenosa TaxID=2774145 RepID=A0AAW3ZSI3_9GAMM|nr:GspH/FimT family pseudopilin [Pseudomarimonas arenosa]
MVVITLIGIMSAMVYPSFREAIVRNRLASQSNELMAALTMARAEAIRRNRSMVFCAADANQTNCQAAWGRDWLVFDDINEDGDVDAGEDIIQVGGIEDTEVYEGATMLIRFDRRGFRVVPAGGNVIVEVKPTDCTLEKPWVRQVQILATGSTNNRVQEC